MAVRPVACSLLLLLLAVSAQNIVSLDENPVTTTYAGTIQLWTQNRENIATLVPLSRVAAQIVCLPLGPSRI